MTIDIDATLRQKPYVRPKVVATVPLIRDNLRRARNTVDAVYKFSWKRREQDIVELAAVIQMARSWKLRAFIVHWITHDWKFRETLQRHIGALNDAEIEAARQAMLRHEARQTKTITVLLSREGYLFHEGRCVGNMNPIAPALAAAA